MMIADILREALKNGEANLNLRERNIKEINKLIEQVNLVIQDVSANKVELVAFTRDATFIDLVKYAANSAVQTTVEDQSGRIDRKILRIRSINHPKVYTDLTSLDLSENGFPCTMVIGGNDRIARDIETLEGYFSELLSTYRAIEAIKKAELANED
ncbi:hypothetical protein [Acinetobacter pollinis]|uniref:hypothetical protein n=1 Tax=Acinetobacter pollinis TaxID=2605270 RepID=UPI0018A28ADA|nr:hypothetical protein [Acinetobacter pollinis]MBF7690852.1 hypothetical protein [Acinetobacter pollinis]MBF7698497.1 hypothetical protein [Acinetobacter pollinis]